MQATTDYPGASAQPPQDWKPLTCEIDLNKAFATLYSRVSAEDIRDPAVLFKDGARYQAIFERCVMLLNDSRNPDKIESIDHALAQMLQTQDLSTHKRHRVENVFAYATLSASHLPQEMKLKLYDQFHLPFMLNPHAKVRAVLDRMIEYIAPGFFTKLTTPSDDPKSYYALAAECLHKIETDEANSRGALYYFINKHDELFRHDMIAVAFTAHVLNGATKLSYFYKMLLFIIIKQHFYDYMPMCPEYLYDFGNFPQEKTPIIIADFFSHTNFNEKLECSQNVLTHGVKVSKSAHSITHNIQFLYTRMSLFNYTLKSIAEMLENPARIINVSQGLEEMSDDGFRAHEAVMTALTQAGKVIIFAAGNEGCPYSEDPVWQKCLPLYHAINADDSNPGYVILAAAADVVNWYGSFHYEKADYSNYPDDEDERSMTLTAPIMRQDVAGTSFAAPEIAAMLAAFMGAFPKVPSKSLVKALINSAEIPENSMDLDLYCGMGIPNMQNLTYIVLGRENLIAKLKTATPENVKAIFEASPWDWKREIYAIEQLQKTQTFVADGVQLPDDKRAENFYYQQFPAPIGPHRLEQLCLMYLKTYKLLPSDLYHRRANIFDTQSNRHASVPLKFLYQAYVDLSEKYRHLSTDECAKVTTLQIRGEKWCLLPPELKALTALKEILIWGAKIFTLPEWITQLETLEILTVRSCYNITSLPDDIRTLNSLKTISMEFSQLTSFPIEHADDYPNLTSLNLRCNKLPEAEKQRIRDIFKGRDIELEL